jgi:hypothetical protein
VGRIGVDDVIAAAAVYVASRGGDVVGATFRWTAAYGRQRGQWPDGPERKGSESPTALAVAQRRP